MSTATTAATAVQVYRVYIKAEPEDIWAAITDPAWTERYGYSGRAEFDLRPGGRYRAHTTEEMKAQGGELGFDVPDVMVDGEVLECDPPRRLVQTFRMLMDPVTTAEGFTRLTYEIEKGRGGVTRVTVTHDVRAAPKLASLINGGQEATGAGGGWNWVLSDLKTLLETGTSFAG